MSRPTAKISVNNATDSPRTVAVEPWAVDSFTLLPGGDLTLVALGGEGQTETPWFGIVEWNDATQIYCEATEDYYVEQDGRRLQWGREISEIS